MHRRSIAVNFTAMPDAADDDSLQRCIRQIKHAIIANTNAKPVPVFQFLATGRERVLLQSKNRFGNPNLYLRMQSGEFFARIAGDVNLPAHALMFSSFKTWRNGWRG